MNFGVEKGKGVAGQEGREREREGGEVVGRKKSLAAKPCVVASG